ncbi:MAG: hypothetical protein ACI8Y6_000538 [Brevundimonas sp.]|jgi:hypothetical protein
MRRLKFIASLGWLAVAACGPMPEGTDEAAKAAPPTPRFEGRLASGTPADARASGFTDCTADGAGYYGFACAAPEATLLGVKPLRAVVRLTYPSDLAYDAPRRPEDTRYDSIEYQFLQEPSDWREDCAYQPSNPYACHEDQTKPLPSLTRALAEQGWLGRSNRAGVQYVKPGEPFMISLGTRAFRIDDDTRRLAISVAVAPVSDEERDGVIKAVREAAASRASRARDADAFIAEMGGPARQDATP